jgi:hypothetical protein
MNGDGRDRPVTYRDPVDATGPLDLDAAAQAGWLTRATMTGLKPVRRYSSARFVLDVLDEDRGGALRMPGSTTP